MEYYQFTFEKVTETQKEVLTAMLNEIGFTGFEEEAAVLKAFINTQDFNENEFENIISLNSVKYSKSIIKEINWNSKWESEFEPVTIFFPETDQPFAYLRANFHPVNIELGYNIEVTPKMSFGTGHHATTYLMIEQMSNLNFGNQHVIDFGTGTGVLAILAEKMDATSILAIDNDDWSIDNAKENIENNNCSHIELIKAETIPAGQQAGIILANINLNIIIANLDNIINACKPGGTILFSGIMKHDEPIIFQALKEKEIDIREHFYRKDWLIIRAQLS